MNYFSCVHTVIVHKKYEIKPGKTHSEYVQCLGDMAVEGDGDNILAYRGGSRDFAE